MSPSGSERPVLALLVSLGLVFAVPALAQEASRPDSVRITLDVVSGGGESLRGGEVRVSPWPGPGPGVFELDALGTPPGVWLERGTCYLLEIRAPSHEMRRVPLVPGTVKPPVRVVLNVDPYMLPELRAAAPGDGGGARAGSVSHVRFDDEPLAYATVDEWLRDVPGVSVRSRGGGGRQVVTVRGSRPEDVLVLLDGVPLNDAVTGRADLSALPTSTLQSATLLRGSASHRYGSGASAGVLLLTTRVPVGTEVGGAARAESYGSLGLDAHAGWTGGPSRIGLFVSTSTASNDFRYENRVLPGAPREVRTNADGSSIDAALSAVHGPVQATLRYDGVERGVPGRMGTTVFDEARASDRSWVAGVGLSSDRGHVSGSFRDTRLDYLRDAESREESQRVRAARVEGERSLGSAPVSVGGRVSIEGVEGDGIEGEPTRSLWGLHAAGVLRAGPVRWDPAIAVDVSGSESALSPELGVTWRASSGWRVWLRAGQGFRLPTFGDLYFASAYRVRPNPDLDPERVILDAEIGTAFETRAGGLALSGGATAWYRRTEDPIVWLASSVAVWSPQNLDELESRGVEGQLYIDGPRLAGLGWRLELVGALQHSRVGFGTNRNPLPYEPGASGRASLFTWRERTGLRLDLRHTGSRTTGVSATRELPAFTTLDISLTRAIPLRGLDLSALARVENVLDERFEMIELFPEPGRRLVVRLEARRSAATIQGER